MSSSSRRSARHFIRSRPRHPPGPRRDGRTVSGSRTSKRLWSARSLSRNLHRRLSMAIVEQCVPHATPPSRRCEPADANPFETMRKWRPRPRLCHAAGDAPSYRTSRPARRHDHQGRWSRATTPARPAPARSGGWRSETPERPGLTRHLHAWPATRQCGRGRKLSPAAPSGARGGDGSHPVGGSPPATPPRAANPPPPTMSAGALDRSAPPPARARRGPSPRRGETPRRTARAAVGQRSRASRGVRADR